MQRDPAPAPSNAGTTGLFVLLWAAWVLVPVGLAVAAIGSACQELSGGDNSCPGD